MTDTRTDQQFRKALVKLLKDAEKKGGQPTPDWYVKEIMTTKSIASVKREVKRIENTRKKVNSLKKSQQPRSFAELSKQYVKLKKKEGIPDQFIQANLKIWYKNKKPLLEKDVLLMENKYNKMKKKSKKSKN